MLDRVPLRDVIVSIKVKENSTIQINIKIEKETMKNLQFEKKFGFRKRIVLTSNLGITLPPFIKTWIKILKNVIFFQYFSGYAEHKF